MKKERGWLADYLGIFIWNFLLQLLFGMMHDLSQILIPLKNVQKTDNVLILLN